MLPSLLRWMMPVMQSPSSDRYGIPSNYFGAVDDEFYGVVGRIVLVASLVELQLFHLLSTLDGRAGAQERHAGTPTTTMIRECRRRVAGEPDLGGPGFALLDRAAVAFENRHDIVHNSWPHPTLDSAYGWRPAPVRLRGAGGPWTVDVKINQDQLQALIAELVALAGALATFRQEVLNQRLRRSAGAS
jgi:hypothetical protein